MNFGPVQNKSVNRVMNEAMNQCAPTSLGGMKQVVCDLQEQISQLYQSIGSLRSIVHGDDNKADEVMPCAPGLDGDLRNAVERLRLLNALAGDLLSRF